MQKTARTGHREAGQRRTRGPSHLHNKARLQRSEGRGVNTKKDLVVVPVEVKIVGQNHDVDGLAAGHDRVVPRIQDVRPHLERCGPARLSRGCYSAHALTRRVAPALRLGMNRAPDSS